MPEEIHDLFEIITTTRSMRRLKPDPVPDELIRKILEAGTCAPSGGNMQRWGFLVVKDATVKATMGGYYGRSAKYIQSCVRRYKMRPQASGIVSHGSRSQPAASSSRTRAPLSSVNGCAKAQPEEPAPTKMES